MLHGTALRPSRTLCAPQPPRTAPGAGSSGAATDEGTNRIGIPVAVYFAEAGLAPRQAHPDWPLRPSPSRILSAIIQSQELHRWIVLVGSMFQDDVST